MKPLPIFLTGVIFMVACTLQPDFDQTAGILRMAIDNTGKIKVLEDIASGTNYIAWGEESYLMECSLYEGDSASARLQPEAMQILENIGKETKLELTYPGGIKLTVMVTAKEDYFRMELLNADPVSELSHIVWGPVRTNMRGHIGEWLGLNRSNDFTIGLLGLEPNTDGINHLAAAYTAEGSEMFLASYDHSRGRFVGALDNRNLHLRKSEPLPGITPEGSAVALFGCIKGKEAELKIIEKIALAEGLPHPTFDGIWNKYSDEGKRFCVWGYYNEENFNDYLQLSKELGARILCRPGGFSGNWGHFDINTRLYPGGVSAIKSHSLQAKQEGIGLTLYTLTTFLKPNPDPEPYLTPVPDERLQTWRPETVLAKPITAGDTLIILQHSPGVEQVLLTAANKVIRIGDEFIEFKKFTIAGNEIRAHNCQRGAFHTLPAAHSAEGRIRLMYVAGYHNFYPGTLELSNEFAGRLSDLLIETDLDNFVVDGFESCLETGYGAYTGNIFLKNFHDKLVKNNKEALVTTSFISQYAWHIFSHISWGEGDTERGVRGTMLDYRLSRQLELSRNLMPNKMGQYYPSIATAEDINWIMALATGWDGGLDFQLDVKKVRENPEYQKIVETLQLWEEARADDQFTDEQRMALRQTDVLFKLSKKPDGIWDLAFDRFWQNENIKVLPPSAMNARPLNGGTETVRPLSIDWSWTHNPGLYDEVGLSDDLVQNTGVKETTWTVSIPSYTERTTSWYPTSDRHFQFVIRLPEDAPCAVSNFRVSVNQKLVEIPCTLQPGQYLSIPHLLELACIYGPDHRVAGEVYLHGYIPKLEKGSEATVSLSCEPANPDASPEVILNVRCQNGYFYHR